MNAKQPYPEQKSTPNSPDSLSSFIEETIGDEHLRIDEDFGHGFVRLKSSEAQRRQAAQDIRCSEDVLIELLRNSRDAGAKNIFVAVAKNEKLRSIVVIDDGSGIPKDMFSRVFEPRVTSKLDSSHMDLWGLHGRGMALYSIKVNSQLAEIVCSEEGYGTALKVLSDTSKLAEKTDQSTFPRFEIVDNKHVMRGPKNLIRTAVEFALEHRGEVNVYFGSPAEIAATMYSYGCSVIPVSKRAFVDNRPQQDLFKRLCFSPDPVSLSENAAHLGLEISERTARRAIDGKIKCLSTLLDMLSLKIVQPKEVSAKRNKTANSDSFESSRHVHLNADDMNNLSSDIMEAFEQIAERYYLEKDVEPRITCRNGEIQIVIPTLEKME